LLDLTTTKVSKKPLLKTIANSEVELSLSKPPPPENKEVITKEKEDPELKVTPPPAASSSVT